MFITDSIESRNLDRAAINLGLKGLVLMENASRSIFQIALDFWPDLALSSARPVAVLVGPGQNGGDGLVLARLFAAKGHPVMVYRFGHPPQGDAAVNLALYNNLGLPINDPATLESLRRINPAALLIDAVFGVGLKKKLNNDPTLNEELLVAGLASHLGPVLAVDLPSGLSADTGEAFYPVKKADLTVTIGTYKRGLFLRHGPSYSGAIRVADLGYTPEMFEKARPKGQYLDESLARSFLKPRFSDGHKGSFGHATLAGGGPGKTGALALATLGALRSGCGLVTAAYPQSASLALTQDLISAMTLALPVDAEGQLAPKAADSLLAFIKTKNKPLGLGPGLGLDQSAERLVHKVASDCLNPLVLDADALTLLANDLNVLTTAQGPRIMTPHPGEAGRLLGVSSKEIEADRFKALMDLGQATKAVVLLKGANTLILEPLSLEYLINSSGGPILAVGGSGDVLTGLITGLLAQGHSPFKAAALGAFVHGRAGDLAAQKYGSRGVLPTEMAAFIPEVFASLADGQASFLAQKTQSAI
ncbi:MAG: NAD(P)H-hydrate dehydratase [Deltaproteobacteria bacterium]|jgi:NAD(P)H-hydrate epimerase|nr:NAD(P)H-hydrate dehydratase [Deltaproteobacteria bacterium]